MCGVGGEARYLLLLDGDGVRGKVDVLRVVVQCGAFAVNSQGAILVAQVLLQQSLRIAEQPLDVQNTAQLDGQNA